MQWIAKIIYIGYIVRRNCIFINLSFLHANSCQFMSVHANSCKFMQIHVNSWQFMTIHDNSCQFMSIHSVGHSVTQSDIHLVVHSLISFIHYAFLSLSFIHWIHTFMHSIIQPSIRHNHSVLQWSNWWLYRSNLKRDK